MIAANDNLLVRSVRAAIIPASIVVMWFSAIVFALAAAGGLFR